MARRTYDHLNRPTHDSHSVNLALTAYETALFRKILEKQAPEKARDMTANDAHRLTSLFDSLS